MEPINNIICHHKIALVLKEKFEFHYYFIFQTISVKKVNICTNFGTVVFCRNTHWWSPLKQSLLQSCLSVYTSVYGC